MTGQDLLVIACILAALGTISACGRKAALDTPYSRRCRPARMRRRPASRCRQEPEQPVKDKPFFLDRLI